jgi:hypothetical protein
MAEQFSSRFVPKTRLDEAPPRTRGIAAERREATELAVEGGRFAYRFLHYVFARLLSIVQTVRGEKGANPTELAGDGT